jgi:hypothetical protein
MRAPITIRFFGLAVVIAVALASIGLPQVASKPNARAATTRLSPRQHGPMRFHGVRPDGTVESENWSGYAVTGSSFTQALGSWIVPTVTCSGIGGTPGSYAAFWVGLDGYSSSSVEQTGTDSDCNGDTPSYYAWYEFYPKFAVTITSLTISPGDIISAEVNYSGKEFTITIKDLSTGQSYGESSKVPQAKRSSAEWIAESPSSILSNFGKVSFGQDYDRPSAPVANYATDSSKSEPISYFGTSVEKITMVSSKGADEAAPTSLTSDGTSFQVTWISQ